MCKNRCLYHNHFLSRFREILREPSVLSNYEDICLDSNLKLDKEVSMDLLEHLVALYIPVRTFSFAKDVREKHKLAKKQVKNGPYELKLRKAISRED